MNAYVSLQSSVDSSTLLDPEVRSHSLVVVQHIIDRPSTHWRRLLAHQPGKRNVDHTIEIVTLCVV